MSGIYTITNVKNNKMYIGSTISFTDRWKHHRNALNRGNHDNSHLQRAWNKYGEEAFLFEILEECAKEELIENEKFWSQWLCGMNGKKSLYNLTPIAGSSLGYKHTPESLKKMREAKLGTKRPIEIGIKISQANTGKSGWAKGKQWTEARRRAQERRKRNV